MVRWFGQWGDENTRCSAVLGRFDLEPEAVPLDGVADGGITALEEGDESADRFCLFGLFDGAVEMIVLGEGGQELMTIRNFTPGDYFGPDGPGELGGFPALGVIDDAALNTDVATQLWETGETATGISYP